MVLSLRLKPQLTTTIFKTINDDYGFNIKVKTIVNNCSYHEKKK